MHTLVNTQTPLLSVECLQSPIDVFQFKVEKVKLLPDTGNMAGRNSNHRHIFNTIAILTA